MASRDSSKRQQQKEDWFIVFLIAVLVLVALGFYANIYGTPLWLQKIIASVQTVLTREHIDMAGRSTMQLPLVAKLALWICVFSFVNFIFRQAMGSVSRIIMFILTGVLGYFFFFDIIRRFI